MTKRTENRDEAVQFGTATAADTRPAARIYLDAFPGRLEEVCGSPQGAEALCVDLMDLMRRTYPETFFTAHGAGGLDGYLVLTVPGRSVLVGMLRGGFFLRASGKLLVGRYGSPIGIFRRVIARARARRKDEKPADLQDSPHVYVVAVSDSARGRGIGARLLRNARDAIADRFPRLWLSVDIDNPGAVRFYERMGLDTVATGDRQHHMVWTFDEGGATGGDGD